MAWDQSLTAEPEAEVTRRLTTIVAIDVAGYSRLMGADEAGTLARRKEHRSVTDPIAETHGEATESQYFASHTAMPESVALWYGGRHSAPDHDCKGDFWR